MYWILFLLFSDQTPAVYLQTINYIVETAKTGTAEEKTNIAIIHSLMRILASLYHNKEVLKNKPEDLMWQFLEKLPHGQCSNCDEEKIKEISFINYRQFFYHFTLDILEYMLFSNRPDSP